MNTKKTIGGFKKDGSVGCPLEGFKRDGPVGCPLWGSKGGGAPFGAPPPLRLINITKESPNIK